LPAKIARIPFLQLTTGNWQLSGYPSGMPTRLINGVNLFYQDRGRGSPVVLVHGFPLDSRMWEAQIEALSDRHRVIAPDLRGFGQSKSDGPFTIASQADDLHALLKATEALPCAFCGLSMGGYVALAFARSYSSDLKALALIDTRSESDTPQGKENRAKMMQLVREHGAKAVADQMLPKLIAEQTAQHRQDIVHKLRHMMESQSPGTIENALVAMRDREDYTHDLSGIRVPTLILVGEHDAITPPPVSESMSKLIRHPTLVIIKRAGHMAPMEQPDDVTTAMRRFLEQASR
jgi:pimeloyl-ACP methyl ester carboxylesterase